MSLITRRDVSRFAAVAAAASIFPMQSEAAGNPTSESKDRGFPRDFLWGSATAAYQVEGAVNEDGRGTSIWDTFSHTPGKTFHGDTGDVATDSYHRYKEDIALMKSLGLKTCRFSIAWPRIFPEGKGTPNQRGIDHYRRFVGALREAGIEPYCTLYHWDLPQPLEDKGGWQSKDTSKAFADYAGYTASQLGSSITHYMTTNEIGTFIELGYHNGLHAPGVKLSRKGFAQTKHHALLGHGMAVQAIRASAGRGVRVGCAESLEAVIPAFNAEEHIEAARRAMVEENASILTAIQSGRYTDRYLQELGSDAPVFTAEEMKIIGSPTDFQGLNIYRSKPVRADSSEKGYVVMAGPKSYPHMESPWLTIGPEALYWSPKLVAEVYGVKEIYITENGCSSTDEPATDGEVYDTDRVMYLNAYITQMQRGVSEGVPIKGYFLWSLLDNFEWAEGYSQRFGINYVDFATQKRTPKLSAKFYKHLIAKNAL